MDGLKKKPKRRPAELPLAHEVYVGMRVRKQLPGGPDHYITEVSLDPATNYVRITTNSGTWVFLPSEHVTFPRRPDGSIRDWRDADEAPVVVDVAVGDIFPPGWELPPYSQADEKMRAFHASHFQRVTAIHAHRINPQWFWWLTMSEAATGRICRYLFPISAQVKFPYVHGLVSPWGGDHVDEDNPRPKARPRTVKFDAYGPYINPAGDVVMIASHPYGRGRWPDIINDGIVVNDKLTLVRPPGHTHAHWSGWTFASEKEWRRHTHDPGVPMSTPVASDYEDAYVHYRYPEDLKYGEDEQTVLERRSNR